MVLLARHNEHRTTRDVLVVDLRLGPGIEVGERRLKEGLAGRGHGVGLEELLGFIIADRVGKGIVKLLEGQRIASMLVARVLENRGLADRRADTGKGKTPRKGAASTATVAAERPLPAKI